jgi:4-hydroxybenzoate polyprenyltransferase
MFIAAYPLMKRITFYPQVFLGLTMNLGILFVSISVLGKITLTSFLIYLVGIVWTIIYDTIYGYQDLQDDLQIGVKSTSIKFGEKPQRILFSLALVFFAFLMILGIYSQFKFPFFALSSLAFFHLLCQIKTCNFADGKDCLKKFKSNFWVGIIILIAIILS